MEKWKVLESETVIDNRPYNATRRDRCLLPNGLEIDFYGQEYPNWVNAIVMTRDHQVALVRQYRHGVSEFVLETPGGMLEDGEDTAAAIVREVAEETGFRSEESPIFLGEFYPNAATSNNRVSTWLLLNATRTEAQSLDSTEEIAVELMPFEEFGRRVMAGQVPAMFSAIGYFLVKEYLSRGSE